MSACLVISGFPDDVKPREVRNLFRSCLGFMHNSVEVKITQKGINVFVSFVSPECASSAMGLYANYPFDDDCILKVEQFDRAELSVAENAANIENELSSGISKFVIQAPGHKITESSGSAVFTNGTANGQNTPTSFYSNVSATGSNNSPRLKMSQAIYGPTTSNSNSPRLPETYSVVQPSDQFITSQLNPVLHANHSSYVSNGSSPHSGSFQNVSHQIQNQHSSPSNVPSGLSNTTFNMQYPVPHNIGPNSVNMHNASAIPCTTLFAGNLGVNTSERELQKLFEFAPGFRRVRFSRKGNAPPVAFIEFDSEIYSMNALRTFQGYILPTCERGGIRLDFARTKMGSPSIKQVIGNSNPPFYPPKNHNLLYHQLQRQHLSQEMSPATFSNSTGIGSPFHTNLSVNSAQSPYSNNLPYGMMHMQGSTNNINYQSPKIVDARFPSDGRDYTGDFSQIDPSSVDYSNFDSFNSNETVEWTNNHRK